MVYFVFLFVWFSAVILLKKSSHEPHTATSHIPLHPPHHRITWVSDAVLSLAKAVFNRLRMRRHLLAILGENPSNDFSPAEPSRPMAATASLFWGWCACVYVYVYVCICVCVCV